MTIIHDTKLKLGMDYKIPPDAKRADIYLRQLDGCVWPCLADGTLLMNMISMSLNVRFDKPTTLNAEFYVAGWVDEKGTPIPAVAGERFLQF